MTRKIVKFLALSVLVLVAWAGIQAALALAAKPGQRLAVFGLEDQIFITVASAGGTIVRAGKYFIITQSDQPDFVRRLYQAGALLVVDARAAGGCLDIARIRGTVKRR